MRRWSKVLILIVLAGLMGLGLVASSLAETQNKPLEQKKDDIHPAAKALLERSKILLEKGYFNAAISDIREAYKYDPKLIDQGGKEARFMGLILAERYDEALYEIDKEIKAEQGGGTGVMSLKEMKAMLYLAKGDFDAAEAEMRLRPEEGVNMQAAVLRIRQGRYDEAVAEADKLIAGQDKDMKAFGHAFRGLARIKQGGAGLADLTQAIQLAPEAFFFYIYRALAHVEAGDPAKAQADLDKMKEVMKGQITSVGLMELLLINFWIGPEEKELEEKMALAKAGGRPGATPVAAGKPRPGCVAAFPNRYLLAVAVSDYSDLPKLGYVKNDLRTIRDLAQCHFGVPRENVVALENPSPDKLKKELRAFVRRMKTADALTYVYYSGHGVLDSRGQFYLLPPEANIATEDLLKDTGLPLSYVLARLAEAKGQKLLLLDACRITPTWKPAVLAAKVTPDPAVTVVFSTRPGEISHADREGRSSAFTRALKELVSAGLRNMDQDESGYIELQEMVPALKQRLREVSVADQTPEVAGQASVKVFPTH